MVKGWLLAIALVFVLSTASASFIGYQSKVVESPIVVVSRSIPFQPVFVNAYYPNYFGYSVPTYSPVAYYVSDYYSVPSVYYANPYRGYAYYASYWGW